MAKPVVISVQSVGKKYCLRHEGRERYTALRDVLASKLRLGAQKPRVTEEDFWALSDVSFDVAEGDSLAIIGRNGAGKSTLLKLLSRITTPTRGTIQMEGRVGSLLEVGTGFHPELSGRENIALNGAILGMSQRELRRKFDEIVAFAEIEKFLDTPVKRYSSGMYVRLAFAVAAHLEPDILVVDEVLAVGDAAFQKKCLGRMSDVAGRQGRTVLFVSHNMAAVRSLCNRAIVLDRGNITYSGDVSTAVARYLESGAVGGAERRWGPDEGCRDPRARLRAARARNASGEIAVQPGIDEALVIEVEYECLTAGSVLNLSLSIYTQEDSYVLASPSGSDPNWYLKPHPAGIYVARCELPASLFNTGRYFVSVLLVAAGTQVIAQEDRALSIDFTDHGVDRQGYFGYWGGVVRPSLRWNTTRVTDDARPAVDGP